MLVAIVASIVAAGAYAAGTALLHRSAGIVHEATRGASLGSFVTSNARHPLWLLGMLAQGLGFGLHALALRDGPLTLVQPMLVIGVVFALPIRRLLEHRKPEHTELLWAAALTAGLVVFFLAATPAEGPPSAPDLIPTIVAVVGTASGMTLCAIVGWRTRAGFSAAVYGIGAGLGFGGTAGLLKEVTSEIGGGVLPALTNWPLYGLLLAGLAGLLLGQLAYRAAPLRASLPTMTTVEPVLSLAIGVGVFDEPFRTAPLALFGEVAGLLVVIWSVVSLTRREPEP